ncbi:SDR family oxidoreductase [Sphingomonas sp.]|uniref:SDR family oxidoreductase n=1 Tax=Sphingomonas sp. TaxID=28214 RepID=UPI002B726F21|nr:SDR family oxidoreductase [Sphingomonas sp.]HWK36575.1 SDR family oxidoreductase [Sphingomonas sp.]
MRPLALVTGSCRRLGAHIAARLAEAGYDLALHTGHDPEPEPWLGARIAAVEHHVFAADLADSAAVEALPEQVAAHFGRPVALLVNSASRFEALDGARPGEGGGYEDLAAHLRVNCVAPYALATRVSAAGAAAVINILDQRIAQPPVDQLAYTLSKQALAEVTRTLAVALAPRTRVNGVAPGLTIPTPDYGAAQLDRLAAMMPLAHLPAPEDVADAVAWLAQARSVTGQVVYVDAGAHLRSYQRDFVHLGR